MTSSGFFYDADIIKRMAIGYKVTNAGQAPGPFNTVPIGWSAPAGGAYSSANDLISFMKFVFRGGTDDVLSGGILNEYFLPGVILSDVIS